MAKDVRHSQRTILIGFAIIVAIIVSALLLSGGFNKKNALASVPITLVSEPKPQFKVELTDCEYDSVANHHELDRFWFFFKITNIGNIPTRILFRIYLVPEKSVPIQTDGNMVEGKIYSHIYGANEIIGGEVQWANGMIGDEWYWEITPRKDFNYKLVYCEGDCTGYPINETFSLNDGLVAYGLVIYDGNTYSCETHQS